MKPLRAMALGQLLIISLATLLANQSWAGEVLTYRFAGDAPNYKLSGDTSQRRASVTGTFTVEIDRAAGTGALLSLDAYLTDIFTAPQSVSGGELLPADNGSYKFLEGASYDAHRPPFSGLLKDADFRPLGLGTLTVANSNSLSGQPLSTIPRPLVQWAFDGVGWVDAPDGAISLDFDGRIPNADGWSFRIGPSYNIYFEGDVAFFSYHVPIMDAVQSIGAARAVLVPSPTACALGLSATLVAGLQRRR